MNSDPKNLKYTKAHDGQYVYTSPPRFEVEYIIDWVACILLHFKFLDGFNFVGVLNNKYNMKKACLNFLMGLHWS